MSQLGIVAPRPEKHNLCKACAGLQITGNGCLVKHCPLCEGPMLFSTRICLRCSTSKGLCQSCQQPLEPAQPDTVSSPQTITDALPPAQS